MKVEYNDKNLSSVIDGTSDELCKAGVPLEIVESFRAKIQFLKSVIDERDIRNWKSLRYEKLKGDRQDFCSIRLNNKWRLIFKIDGEVNPKTIIVYGVEDYH